MLKNVNIPPLPDQCDVVFNTMFTICVYYDITLS